MHFCLMVNNVCMHEMVCFVSLAVFFYVFVYEHT